nr:MAG TPA: hypothetical protein [Caudoviricetes sp.]
MPYGSAGIFLTKLVNYFIPILRSAENTDP